MTLGKAHGRNRQYQLFCRSALQRLRPGLEPYSGDGIDVPFDVGGTRWWLDVALKASDGSLAVAECRRRRTPVKQEDVAAFAYKVELLRIHLRTEVAGVFFARRHAQVGAVRGADWAGIQVVVCEQDQLPAGFSLVFHSYDQEREARVREGRTYADGTLKTEGGLTLQVIRKDGKKEDPIKVK